MVAGAAHVASVTDAVPRVCVPWRFQPRRRSWRLGARQSSSRRTPRWGPFAEPQTWNDRPGTSVRNAHSLSICYHSSPVSRQCSALDSAPAAPRRSSPSRKATARRSRRAAAPGKLAAAARAQPRPRRQPPLAGTRPAQRQGRGRAPAGRRRRTGAGRRAVLRSGPAVRSGRGCEETLRRRCGDPLYIRHQKGTRICYTLGSTWHARPIAIAPGMSPDVSPVLRPSVASHWGDVSLNRPLSRAADAQPLPTGPGRGARRGLRHH